MLDEVFGVDKFLSSIIIKVNTKMQKYRPTIGTEHEYMLCYSKSNNYKLNYVVNDNYKYIFNNINKF